MVEVGHFLDSEDIAVEDGVSNLIVEEEGLVDLAVEEGNVVEARGDPVDHS